MLPEDKPPEVNIPEVNATPTEQRAAGKTEVQPYTTPKVDIPTSKPSPPPEVKIGKIDPYVEYQRKAEVARTEAVGFSGPYRWKGDGWGRYDIDDWLRSYARLNTVVADATVQRQMVEATYKDNGLPADWDWETSKTGPWGDPLPEGAVGWTPLGEADYGPGIAGWWKGQWAKIVDVQTTEELISEIPEQYVGENYVKTRDKLWKDKDILGWLGHTVGAAAKLLQFRIKEQFTENPSPIVRYVAGFASNIAIGGVLELFNQSTIAVERYIGPDLLASADIIDREVAKGTVQWMEWVDKIPVVREASRIALAWTIGLGGYYLGGDKETVEEYKSLRRQYREMEDTDWGIMGSRISYSLATDQMLREDYKSRIRAGADPRLLAMELELPGVELGTRVFLDPLNLLAPFGKLAKANKMTQAARIIHATPIDELVGVSDEIADLVRAGSSRGFGVRAAEITENVRQAFSKVREGILDLSTKRGLRVLTANGKRAVTGRRIGDHLNVLYQHFAGDVDGFFKYINGMVLAASDDVADVQRGIALLADSGAPLNMAFSQAGTEMGVFMREVLVDAATGELRNAKTLLKGLEEGADAAAFMQSVGNKLDDALKNIFPTIHEQISLNDELAEIVKKFGEGSDEVVEFLAKHPSADNIITPGQRLMARADLNMQKYFYSPAVKVQSFVYMRLNPAYAFRNRMTNAFHIFVDQGPVSGIKSFFSPTKAMNEIEDLLGFIPSSATRGFGPKGGVRGLETAFEGGDFWNWSKKSQNYEQMASAQVYSKSIRESMRKGLQEGVAIPSRSFLTGFTDEESDLVISLAKKHNGNIAKIQDDIRRLASEEGVDAAKNLLFLDDDGIKTLKDLRLYDDAVRIGREADDLDQVDELLDALYASYSDEAARAASEAAVLGEPTNHIEAAEVADNLALEEGLAEAGGKADETADLMARQILADRAMIKEQEVILAEMEQDLLLEFRSQLEIDVAAGRTSAQQANQTAKRMVDDLVAPIRSQTTQITDDAVRSADNLRNGVLEAKNKSFGIGRRAKGPERDALFRKVWGATSLPAKPATFFVDMTPKKFRRLMWEEFFPTRNSIWVTRREQVFALNNVMMHQSGAVLGRSAEEMGDLLGRTYRAAAKARMFGHATLLEDGTAVLRMTGEDLRSALLQSHRDITAAAIANKTPGAVGRLEVGTTQLDGLLERLAKRPDMTIEQAYSYLDEAGRDALRAIAGDELARQQEALQFILYDSKFRTVEELSANGFPTGINEIVGPGIGEMRVGKAVINDAGDKLPTLYNIKAEGAGEEGLLYWVRDLDANGERQFLTTFQTEDIVDEAGEVAHGGKGFFKRMEEKGYIEYVDDVVTPGGLSDKPYKRYNINADAIKPKGPNVFEHRLTVDDAEGFMYTPARNAYETQSAAKKAIEDLRRGLHENWGDLRRVTISPEMERSSQAWLGEMNSRVTQLKGTAVEVANQTRDFILLDYEARTGLDNVLSYIYPYHFWYKGTYTNWLSRVRYNPALASRYGQYRKWLEKIHAGMPDWWKYNINVQKDLLGIETDHPFWFNLEATLNPMNGITGVDFNDPRRRLDWWSATADDLGKFGPTIWTPYSLAIATAYHIQGEDDAAARWAGRLTPLTRTFRDATALLGINEGKGVEVDPFLQFFSGGIDPYERARIGRMLSAMVDEAKYPEAAIVDAAYTQEGPIWEEARSRAINQRAPNALSIAAPFFLGVGFKPRTDTDIEIDRMYSEMYGHMGNKANLSPEAYQEGWDQLRNKYPFMDVLLMSRKSGDARDEALAWNVLDRIPPGMTDDIAKLVGIQEKDISNFYDSKGSLNDMTDANRMRFMAAVLDIGALLDLPDAPTRAEWDTASLEYKSMLTAGKEIFGEDIWDRTDIFFGKADEDRNAYLKSNPDVEQALDWQQKTIISNPLLAPYYTSIDRIEKYLNGQMYDAIEKELGDSIWDKWEVWHRLDAQNSKDARAYWKDHPELERYGEIKDEYAPRIATAMLGIASMIPEAKPPNWRGAAPDGGFVETDNENEAWIRSEVLKYSTGKPPSEATAPAPQLPDLRVLQELIHIKGGVSLDNLISDYLLLGVELPAAAKEMLDDLADQLGLSEGIMQILINSSQLTQ